MLTRANAIDVQAESQKLYRLPSGNNGRTFRRFLGRMIKDQVLAMAFADGSIPMDAKEVKLYKKYAELHLEKVTAAGRYLDDMVGAAVVVDAKRSYVAIHFPMAGFSETMSQNEMRSMVMTVNEIVKSMKAFAENPAGEIYTVSPEGIKERRRLDAQVERDRHERFMSALNRAFPGKLAA
jgi:hypothetical protein